MKKIVGRFASPSEFAFVIFIFAVSLFFFIGAFSYDEESRVFPLFTSSATLILTVMFAIKQLRSPAAETKPAPVDGEQDEDRDSTRRVLTTLACFVGYIIIVYLFGFLIAATVIGLAYPLLHGYRKPLGVILSLAVNLGIVLLFQSVLGVPLSRGLLLDMTPFFY